MWIKDLMDSLRVIAKDPSAAETGLILSNQHVIAFLDEYGGDVRTGVEEVMKAVRAEAEAHPSQKPFWMAVHEFVVLPHRLQP
jgi:hypothetical protein